MTKSVSLVTKLPMNLAWDALVLPKASASFWRPPGARTPACQGRKHSVFMIHLEAARGEAPVTIKATLSVGGGLRILGRI